MDAREFVTRVLDDMTFDPDLCGRCGHEDRSSRIGRPTSGG
jgi:hypothetical protein